MVEPMCTNINTYDFDNWKEGDLIVVDPGEVFTLKGSVN